MVKGGFGGIRVSIFGSGREFAGGPCSGPVETLAGTGCSVTRAGPAQAAIAQQAPRTISRPNGLLTETNHEDVNIGVPHACPQLVDLVEILDWTHPYPVPGLVVNRHPLDAGFRTQQGELGFHAVRI